MEKYRSKLGLSTLLITSAGLLLAMSSFAPAFATSPTMKGYGTYTNTTTSVSVVSTINGYTTYLISGTQVLQGVETGSAIIQYVEVVSPNGHAVYTGSNVCSTSCAVGGVAGTFTAFCLGQGPVTGNSNGQCTVTGTGGGLTGLSGMVKFVAIPTTTGFTGPYSLTYTLGTTT